MPMIVRLDCPCCKNFAHHCKRCWFKFHNGEKHQDYIEPKFYGESMNEDIIITMEKEYGMKDNRTIKPNEDKKYIEGEYGH